MDRTDGGFDHMWERELPKEILFQKSARKLKYIAPRERRCIMKRSKYIMTTGICMILLMAVMAIVMWLPARSAAAEEADLVSLTLFMSPITSVESIDPQPEKITEDEANNPVL